MKILNAAYIILSISFYLENIQKIFYPEVNIQKILLAVKTASNSLENVKTSNSTE